MRLHSDLANDSKKDIIGRTYISVRTFCFPSHFISVPRKGFFWGVCRRSDNVCN